MSREEALNQANKVLKWALKSESAERHRAMITLAQSEPGIPITPDEFDRDPFLLNCPNGTLDLRTGKLRDHRREDYLSRLCPTEYDPNATCPNWLRFLDSVFPVTNPDSEPCGDRELIEFVQRLLGHCLTGDVSEQMLPILWGHGANGKSTLVNAVFDVMGNDYAIKAAPELLMRTKGDRHPTELTDLFKIRLAVVSETSQGGRLNESLVKDLTGGEPIRARRMREDFWEFQPTHKVFLLTNHKPRLDGTDHGLRRRLRLIPFTQCFWNPDDPRERAKKLPEALKQDKGLDHKLKNEARGILAWMVRGCLAWQQHGMPIPHCVRDATEEYVTSEDVLARFLEERCEITRERDTRVRATDLYRAYRCWADVNGEKPKSQKWFGGQLALKGFEKTQSNGIVYLGLCLRKG